MEKGNVELPFNCAYRHNLFIHVLRRKLTNPFSHSSMSFFSYSNIYLKAKHLPEAMLVWSMLSLKKVEIEKSSLN